MSDTNNKELCIALIKTDTADEVVTLLKTAGYWDNPAMWRFYGDRETNFNTIGNQMSRSDAALVEKLINSVDARLINECLIRGVHTESEKAPQSIHEAIILFFDEQTNPHSASAGHIRDWTNSKRLQIARGITISATGAIAKGGKPCFTISDCGEGQTPEEMPNTLLSLDKSNKLRIPFVQGKFNMGGTGVLEFCGNHNLQLVVSRRNQELLKGSHKSQSDSQWGFTIVRREDPEGGSRSSVYTYLAPLGSQVNPRKGGILHFFADKMPIFPEGRQPYSRTSEWGTLIKLYEYSATGYSNTHILRKDGLLSRVDLLLPDVALPIRFHECREGYHGHSGSFETTLTGLSVRLNDDKGENLEPDFPSSCPLSSSGEQMTAKIYAFKKGRADTYRKNEGIIFTLNGQTHGHLTKDFFRRTQIGLSYLAESILVIVDCSKFHGRSRESLFMPSRDRLRKSELSEEVEHTLEDLLSHHPGLRALKERRRREEIDSPLEGSKPLEDILKSLIEKYPSLSTLFLPGTQVSNPFKTLKVKEQDKEYNGKRYATYFKFKGMEYGKELNRECHINTRCRITFETDVMNDYFSRDIEPGEFALYTIQEEKLSAVETYSLNLQNGIATLSISLPFGCRVDQIISFIAIITDPSRIDPFNNKFRVHIKKEIDSEGMPGERRKPPANEKGEEREIPSGIQLPKRKRVYEPDWEKQEPVFDQNTALRIKFAGNPNENEEGEKSPDVYDFFINMDNVHLKRYLKYDSKKEKEVVVQTRFDIGLVLVGLALLHQAGQETHENSTNEQSVNIEDTVADVTKAMAPFILPMIHALGSLDLEEDSSGSGGGEAV